MPETTIEKIHTACFGCCFAKKVDNKQIGCSLNLLSKYNQHVISAHDDQNNEFFIINGRFCNFKRSEKWAEGLTLGEANLRARKELALRIELIIYLDKFEPPLLKKTINSASKQKVGISSITVINNTGNLELSEKITDIIAVHKKPWKVQNIVEEEATQARCYDIAIKDCSFPYFLSCKSGYIVPKILHKIDDKINGDLEKISCVGIGGEEHPKAIFGQTAMYKILQGNAGDYTFWQKLMEIQKEENTNIIKRDTEL
jgi:hypothetical protein